ncbi:MAG TPA: exodeoxyribonuclease VII small subunit [Thermoanaerobaculia bacterium]|nr:exodeoxyribonuclease VII small subunit [Thermoanaerobaculia bacterium]
MSENEAGGAPEELGFAAALSELEAILRRIESDETDLDALGRELQRAAQLLDACRGAIRRVEAEVGDVLEKLTDEA